MPRRVRTQPKRYVPDADSQKPKPKAKPAPISQQSVPPSYTAAAHLTRSSRSSSIELIEPVDQDDGHRIRGRTVVEGPPPVPNWLREIHQAQATTKLQIPKLSFARLIREVLLQYTGYGKTFRMTPDSLECIQEAAEIYMVQVFEDSNRCCLHRDRVILCPKDMQLAIFLRR